MQRERERESIPLGAAVNAMACLGLLLCDILNRLPPAYRHIDKECTYRVFFLKEETT